MRRQILKESTMQLVFATNNKHKLEEIRNAVGSNFEILSLADIGFSGDIPETGETLTENSLQKSKFIHDRYKVNCMADDTGLEIEALDGRPGVYSARYAGPECSPEDNMNKILEELTGIQNRKAKFSTVISLILNDKVYYFEGHVNGVILTEKQGEKGFGYDPVFLPDGFDKTFAQMDMQLKNSISHRGLATKELIEFLKKIG